MKQLLQKLKQGIARLRCKHSALTMQTYTSNTERVIIKACRKCGTVWAETEFAPGYSRATTGR